MKKCISTFVLACFLFVAISNTPKLVKPVYGWLELGTIAIIVVVDTAAKWSQKKVNSKGGSRTESYPLPGYGDSDKYWKFEDLEGHFEEYREEYTFMTDNVPAEAIAMLPSDTYDKHGSGSDGGIAVASIRAQATNTPAIDFPWDTKKHLLKKGDIIFTRANTHFSKAAQYFTSWVHAGLVKDVQNDKSYESFYPHGVKTYNPKTDWPEGYSWSVKRVKATSLSRDKIERAVDNAEFFYDGDPYFPDNVLSHIARGEFISKFADKNDTSSFYCTKLVWKAFDRQGIDLDSERTTARVDNNFYKGYTDWGAENKWAWIGVSGDDIYYSKHLDSDIWKIGRAHV